MNRRRSASKGRRGPINIAVLPETHARFRSEGNRRGMKLREVPSFLIELCEVTTPEQQSAAFARFMQRQSEKATA